MISEWTEETFFPEFRARYGERRHDVARRIFDWCRSAGYGIDWVKGAEHGGVRPWASREGRNLKLFKLAINGTIQWYAGERTYVLGGTRLADDGPREELCRRLMACGVDVGPGDLAGKRRKGKKLALIDLCPNDNLDGFIETLDWVSRDFVFSPGSDGR